MNLKRFKSFLNEGMFVDRQGRIRRDSDDESGFNHSPTTERKLMFIEDIYNGGDLDINWLKYILNERYNIEIVTKDIYTELAMAIRDNIISEINIADLLEEIESKVGKKV